MTRTARIGMATLGAAAAGGVVAASVAALAWQRATERAVARLGGATMDDAPAAFAPAQLAGLPAPVARYLALALVPGQPLIRRARVEHAGTFQSRPGQWSPFTSVEHASVRPPGFVWDARIRLAPALRMPQVRVRDGYARGEGAMRGAVAGLVPVVDQRGTRELAEASLQRWLAEAPWFPTALLPGAAGAGVAWAALDDRSARATVTDHGVTATVDFHFGADGEIVRTTADRYRDDRGTPVRTPWVGHFRDWRRVHGMLVPMEGDVGWVMPDGPQPYWRGRVTRAEYAWRGAGAVPTFPE